MGAHTDRYDRAGQFGKTVSAEGLPLFAGSDRGGEHWAVIASLIETCKLNAIDPHAYLTDALERLVAGHPQSRIDDLMPWAYAAR